MPLVGIRTVRLHLSHTIPVSVAAFTQCASRPDPTWPARPGKSALPGHPLGDIKYIVILRAGAAFVTHPG